MAEVESLEDREQTNVMFCMPQNLLDTKRFLDGLEIDYYIFDGP